MAMKHPKPQSKRGRKTARAKVNKRVGIMRQIIRTDPHGPRRN